MTFGQRRPNMACRRPATQQHHKAGGCVVEEEGLQVRSHLALTVSMTAHAMLILALALIVTRNLPPAKPIVEPIDVAILMPPVKPAEETPRQPPPPALSAPAQPDAAPPSETSAPARPRSDGMVTSRSFYAGARLADPGAKGTRKKLEGLLPDERLIQLCNIEATEQLSRARDNFNADAVVVYAMSDPLLTATTVSAKGAAVHAGTGWYRLRFDCEVTPDMKAVTSFRYALGASIPPDQWEAHALPEMVSGEAVD